MEFIPSKLVLNVAFLLMLIDQIFTQDAVVSYTVREEQRADTFIGSVALDSQLFENISNDKLKQLNFQILKEGNKDANYFRVEEETGILWTANAIDREEFPECFLDCSVQFNVGVFDLDLMDYTYVIKIVIEIEDYNDHTPEFIDIKNPLTVSESKDVGSLITSGLATDLDQGANNSVKFYTIFPENENFEIKTVYSENNGYEFELYLKSKLDREKESWYQLLILAKDGGIPQKTGTLILNITVSDANDNDPIFDKPVYETSVFENVKLHTTVLTLHASDKDLDANGKISYKFSNRVSDKILGIFNVNESTGDLTTVGNIDFETDKEFSFGIVAFDHGSPSKSSSASVKIVVFDVNDNSPTINLNIPPGGTVISEQAEVGSFIMHLEIVDIDSGANGQVACNLSDSHFRIEAVQGIENNYKIVLNEKLDHETKASHNVSVLCQDSADTPKQSVTYFMVHVEDSNDNVPQFAQNVYSVTLDENNDVGISITEVSATDEDSGNLGQIEYSLHTDARGLFEINSFTGVIIANVSLDREREGDQVIFRVIAKDKGDPPQSATGTVVVNIKDLNDNAPVFVPDPVVFYVEEEQPSGTSVGNITVTDPDHGMNGTFYFKFPTDPEILEFFSFSNSGHITTAKALDREMKPLHKFTVEAIDMGGKTSSASVLIYVTDINDNYPEIIYPTEYDDTVGVGNLLQPAVEVLKIEARDFDSDKNAELYYYIDYDNASYAFMLEFNTGKLYLNRSLHEKDIGTVYHFYIRVKDGGTPSLASWTELNIRVMESYSSYASNTESPQQNLWIVIAIVIVTAVLSVTMIIVIVKICWCSRRKSDTGSTTEIVMETCDLDPRYVDSLSGVSTSSKDSNSNLKIKDGLQLQNSFEKGYYGNVNEVDCIKAPLENSPYIEQMKTFQYEAVKKLDETTSDNSAELGTRDSGQGGSDLDNSSLTELPNLDHIGSNIPGPSLTHRETNIHKNHFHYPSRSHVTPSKSYHSYISSDNTSDCVIMPNTAANFSHIPIKTAERKELGKLRRCNKRVMFSDDLEHSHSSGRSSAMSSQSYIDVNSAPYDSMSPRRLNRMLSEDSAIDLPDRFTRASNWLRRSADNLKWQRNSDKNYNQLPSNQIKFGSSGDSNSRPMSNNIKTYLDRVMVKTRHSSSNDSQTDEGMGTLQSTGPNDVFTMSRTYQPSYSSQGTESTTTSGSYHLGPTTLNLTNPSFGSDDVFGTDIEI